ncbi:MAG: hypothetical protein CR989_03215 [Flavobacteriales bacterium]|nr:MAG: hypothetical protein CR989_03215 [Flavobacteriales bacterium]
MNKLLYVVMLLVGAIGFAQNDAKAEKLLDEVTQKINGYDNIYIDFTYVLENTEENIKQETRGDVTLKGDLYHVNFLGTKQIFDGKNTYTIITEDQEVNITNAQENEEETLTPSKFFTFYKNGFTYKWDKLENMNGRKIQYVKLLPIDSDSDIKHILLGVDVNTRHIYKLIETGNNNTTTTLTVAEFKPNETISSQLFSFDEPKYKAQGYLINRL